MTKKIVGYIHFIQIINYITFGLFGGAMVIYIRHNIKVLVNESPNSLHDFNWYYYGFYTVWNKLPTTLLYNVTAQRIELHQLGVTVIDQLSFFGYPPEFAVLFSPIALQGFILSKVTWTVLNSLLYLMGLVLLSFSAYSGKQTWIRFLMMAVGLLSSPLYADILLGQVNRLIFFLLSTTIFVLSKTRRRSLAGIFVGLAVIVKIIPLVILGFLLYRREWRVLMGSLIVFVTSTLMTVWILGIKVLLNYFYMYLPHFNQINLEHGPAPWNNSLLGVMEIFASLHTAVILEGIFRVLILFATVLVLLISPPDYRVDLSTAIMTMLLLSPVVEVHYLTLAVVSELILIGRIMEAMEPIPNNITLVGFITKIPPVKGLLLLFAVVLLMYHSYSITYFLAMLIFLIVSWCSHKYSIKNVPFLLSNVIPRKKTSTGLS